MTIDENYKRVTEKILEAANAAGKKKEDMTLVAVTKNYSNAEIQQLYDLGCRNFGENRLQDALPKMEEAPKDIIWHMIGSLQKNKVKKAIGKFGLIHGVDSLDLALKISECSVELGVVTSILLQVNTSGEDTKHGFSEKSLIECFQTILKFPSLKIEGLMTMAPLTDDEKTIRGCFADLRMLKDCLNELFLPQCPMKILSMGMSHDYELAIKEGATHIRIGTALMSSGAGCKLFST